VKLFARTGAADKHAAKRGIAFGGGGGGGAREQAGVDGVSCLGCADDLEQLHHGYLAAAVTAINADETRE